MIGWTPHYLLGKLLFVFSLCLIVYVMFLSPFFCLCFAQVASVLLQCLAALPLLGDPLGLEGCQHSVQPQPFQALWAQREAKCSARGRQQPALEDLGKPGKTTFLHDKVMLGYLCFYTKTTFCHWLVSSKCPWFVCLFKRQKQLWCKTKTCTPKERMCVIFLMLINSCVVSWALEVSACSCVRKCRGVFSVCI